MGLPNTATATAVANGYMAAADKDRVNNIETLGVGGRIIILGRSTSGGGEIFTNAVTNNPLSGAVGGDFQDTNGAGNGF